MAVYGPSRKRYAYYHTTYVQPTIRETISVLYRTEDQNRQLIENSVGKYEAFGEISFPKEVLFERGVRKGATLSFGSFVVRLTG